MRQTRTVSATGDVTEAYEGRGLVGRVRLFKRGAQAKLWRIWSQKT